MNDKQAKAKKTSIGGQALIEGVMMKGPSCTAMAVRTPSGEIDVELFQEKAQRPWYKKTPIIRGMVNFVVMLVQGYKMLMRSAEKAGLDDMDEESKFDKWLASKFGDNMMKVISGVAMVLGVFLLWACSLSSPCWRCSFWTNWCLWAAGKP